MPQNILVATPNPPFGELLRLSLEEGGSYRVRLAPSARQALNVALGIEFELAIIDAELHDSPLDILITGLEIQYPGIRVLLIPPDNNPEHPSIAKFRVDGFVSKPFYLPDLLEKVATLLAQKPARKPAEEEAVADDADHNTPPWARDTELASRVLSRLLTESSAHAAILVRSNGRAWAWSGNLMDESIQEITILLARFRDPGQHSDLARFIRLENDGNEYLLYAKPVLEKMALTLVYDVTMPLTRLRRQAMRLVDALNHRSVDDILSDKPIQMEPDASQPAPLPGEQPSPRPAAVVDEDEYDEEEPLTSEEEMQTRMLADLLASMPAPDPLPNGTASEWVPEMQNGDASVYTFPWEANWLPAVVQTNVPEPEAVKPPPPDLEDTQPVAVRAANTVPVPPEDEEPPAAEIELPDFEPVASGLSALTYVCVLLPRVPQHYITTEKSDLLSRWMAQFCVAFGWRLEGISIRPEYMMWTVRVLPHVSPGSLVRTIRHETSKKLFETFDDLHILNPGRDFWAPAYLIISGSQTPSTQLVRDFIAQTRHKQGTVHA